MADQVDRLLLQVTGEAEVKRLKEVLEAEEKALRAVVTAHGAHDTASRAAAASVINLQGQLRTAETNLAKAGGSTKNFAQGLVQLGYIADDAQYGVASLVNNIQPLLAGLGVGGGLAGAIGIVAVLANQLYKHWDDLERVFGTGGTEDEATRMERLEKATQRTAEETKQLNKYKREQAEIEKLQKAEPEAVTGARSAAEKVLTDRPGGIRGLAEELQRAREVRNPEGLTGRLTDEEVKEAYRKGLVGPGGAAFQGEEFDRRKAEIDKGLLAGAREKEVGAAQSDIGRAFLDPDAFRRLIDELKRTAGLEGLSDQLEAASTEGAKTKKVQEEDKLARDLTIQGLENEAAARAELTKEIESNAKLLAQGNLGTALLAGDDVSASEVQKTLGESGVLGATEDEARQYLDTVKRDLDEQVRQRALKEGITTDDAAERLLRDRQEKALKPQIDAAKKQTGADIIAGQAAKSGASAGQLSQYLQSTFGLPPEVADSLAKDAAEEAGRNRLQDAFRGDKDKPLRSSEVLGSGSSLSESIQRGIGAGGNYEEKNNKELQQIRQVLERISQLPPGAREFVFAR